VQLRIALLAVCALTALGIAGWACGDARSQAPPLVETAGGCHLEAGVTTTGSIVSGGLQRTFRVHIPKKIPSDARLPLVLDFHGRTGSAEAQENLSGLVPQSEEHDFFLVSPDGTGPLRGWAAGSFGPGDPDDVQFTLDLLDQLAPQLCYDSTRVFATGFSNGAFMASRLACLAPDRVRAIAVVSGLDYPQDKPCISPVPVLGIHGLADTTVPFGGGDVFLYGYPGVEAALRQWAELNRCGPDAVEAPIDDLVTARWYQGCTQATGIILLKDWGHYWPGGEGSPPSRFAAAPVIWDFFAAHGAGPR
jgi:polyhydroxybutyrate depolymerase